MKKDLALWQFAGFVITVALGSVLHFLFDWTGTRLLAPISAVNESTWEHMKILFFPMLIFACVQYFIFRDAYAGFWWIKLIGIVVGVILIPILFYTSNGAFGKTRDWLNIAFFFISAALVFFMEYLLFSKDLIFPYPWIAILCIIAIAIFFAMFTFYPPRLPIFRDPLTGVYGI